MVSLNSSQSDVIKLPASVQIPVGVKQVQFPMQVGTKVEGATVQLTAAGANKRKTELVFPTQPMTVKEVVVLKRPDRTLGSVSGVAARSGRVFATFFDFPATGTPPDQQGNGSLVIIERNGKVLSESVRIPVGRAPRAVDVRQVAGKTIAAVVNGGDSFSLSLLEGSGKGVAIETRPVNIPLGQGPIDVAIAPDGKTAYVSNWTANVVHAVDLAAKTQQPLQLFGICGRDRWG